MPASALHPGAVPACKICTIRLEELCYKRAWWFRAFREVLATGIRLFAVALWIRTDEDKPRSKACRRCLRFRKNALKRRSLLFNWLDGYLNPLFNRVRDSALDAKGAGARPCAGTLPRRCGLHRTGVWHTSCCILVDTGEIMMKHEDVLALLNQPALITKNRNPGVPHRSLAQPREAAVSMARATRCCPSRTPLTSSTAQSAAQARPGIIAAPVRAAQTPTVSA